MVCSEHKADPLAVRSFAEYAIVALFGQDVDSGSTCDRSTLSSISSYSSRTSLTVSFTAGLAASPDATPRATIALRSTLVIFVTFPGLYFIRRSWSSHNSWEFSWNASRSHARTSFR